MRDNSDAAFVWLTPGKGELEEQSETFFSIVYEGNAGRQRLFYPDYVLEMDGETWIVEVKGGFTPSGQSENIDAYAPKKAAALAAYCARHGVRGGFVCHDEGDDALPVSEDSFSKDPKAACWRLLDAEGTRVRLPSRDLSGCGA